MTAPVPLRRMPQEPPIADFLAEALERISAIRAKRVAEYQDMLAEIVKRSTELSDPGAGYHPGIADLARRHGETTRKLSLDIDALAARPHPLKKREQPR